MRRAWRVQSRATQGLALFLAAGPSNYLEPCYIALLRWMSRKLLERGFHDHRELDRKEVGGRLSCTFRGMTQYDDLMISCVLWD